VRCHTSPATQFFWIKAPQLSAGVHVAGTGCPGAPQYVLSRSTDGYVIWCVGNALHVLEPGGSYSRAPGWTDLGSLHPMIGLDRKGCERVPAGVHSLVQVGDLLAATLLNVTLARKLGQVCPLLCGVAIGLLAGGVGAVPDDGPSSRSAGYQPNSAASSARRRRSSSLNAMGVLTRQCRRSSRRVLSAANRTATSRIRTRRRSTARGPVKRLRRRKWCAINRSRRPPKSHRCIRRCSVRGVRGRGTLRATRHTSAAVPQGCRR
jgi:hypothetical protein